MVGQLELRVLQVWTGSKWRTTDLAPFVPDDYTIVYAGLTIDTAHGLHVAATGRGFGNDLNTDGAWGHPSCDVFHLVSRCRDDFRVQSGESAQPQHG